MRVELPTYSEPAAYDEQHAYHEVYPIMKNFHYCASGAPSGVYHKINTPTKLADLIRERLKYLESATQDEQNDTQHQCCSSSLKILVLKSTIFALDFTFRREILHDVHGIR